MTRIILAVALGIAVMIGLWFGGWAWYRASLAQQRDANHTSQQWQDAQVAAERDRVNGYDMAVNDGQKAQVRMTFCAVYADLANPPADLVAAHARIC